MKFAADNCANLILKKATAKMNITYKGKTREFTGVEQQKLDAKFARIGKLVDRKGERKAHVVRSIRWLALPPIPIFTRRFVPLWTNWRSKH